MIILAFLKNQILKFFELTKTLCLIYKILQKIAD